MSSGEPGKRRVKITAEVIVEITDDAVLRRDALRAIEEWDFSGAEAGSGTEERATEQARVTEDPVAGIEWLADPYLIVNSAGAEVIKTESSVVEVDDDGHPVL
jgi:hypothetical protein